MGVSTDAMLFLGFELEDYEVPVGLQADGCSNDLYDVVEKWNKAHRPPRPEGDDYQSPAFKAWRAAVSEWEKTSPEYIVSDAHCCQEEPIEFVCVGRLYQRAHRGYPEKIDMRLLLSFNAEDLNQLTLFCKFAGIPWPEDGVGWCLASWWG
jgi:hypothetical protein